MIFLSAEVWLTSVIPWVIFSIILKNRCNIGFFQWPGTSPDHHDFSDTIENGNYVSQFPQDSGMHVTETYRITDVQVPHMVVSLIFTYSGRDITPSVPTFSPICSRVCEEHLPVKTEGVALILGEGFSGFGFVSSSCVNWLLSSSTFHMQRLSYLLYRGI